MVTLNLRGELGRRLTIGVQGYEREACQDPDDANWLRCWAEVDLGGFRGSMDASFTTHDFAQFQSELAQVLETARRVAKFQTMEDCLSFCVEVDRAGRAVIHGQLREIDPKGSTLSFTFDSDLSYLRGTLVDTTKVVSEFPVRGESPE